MSRLPPRSPLGRALALALALSACDNTEFGAPSDGEGAPPVAADAEGVEALLGRHCAGCHPPSNADFGGWSEVVDDLTSGSERLIVPGDPAASLLWQSVSHTGDAAPMPPGVRLPDAEIEPLRQWIEDDAPLD